MPKTVLSCPMPISRAAPVVKATMTECEIKLARSPSLARPMPTCISPQKSASPKIYVMRISSGMLMMRVPPTLMVAIVEKSTIEMALVGPAAIKRDDPHRAAMTTGSMQA